MDSISEYPPIELIPVYQFWKIISITIMCQHLKTENYLEECDTAPQSLSHTNSETSYTVNLNTYLNTCNCTIWIWREYYPTYTSEGLKTLDRWFQRQSKRRTLKLKNKYITLQLLSNIFSAIDILEEKSVESHGEKWSCQGHAVRFWRKITRPELKVGHLFLSGNVVKLINASWINKFMHCF